MQKFALLLASAAALAAAAPAQAQYAQPTGGPLSTLFACQNAGNRQGQGAIVGAIVGGLAGNQIADNDRRSGTVIGALVGAAAGSMIGCRMQNQDVVRAQQATQMALNSGRDQSWNNPQTGASGRVSVVNTYNYAGAGGYNPPAPQRASLDTVRWINGVEQPREYQPSEGTYAANGNTVIRSGPSQRARQLGNLRSGEQVDGLVRVEGTDWVLASRNGQVIGYIQESQARFMGESYATGNQGGYQQGGYAPYQPGRGQMCRTFDQHYTLAGGQTQTERHSACQSQTGEWLIQS
jgi:surface antigen